MSHYQLCFGQFIMCPPPHPSTTSSALPSHYAERGLMVQVLITSGEPPDHPNPLPYPFIPSFPSSAHPANTRQRRQGERGVREKREVYGEGMKKGGRGNGYQGEKAGKRIGKIVLQK